MKVFLIASLAGAVFLQMITSVYGADDDTVRVYVGTYTRGESDGIYLLELDMETGALTSRGLVAETENPSFLAVHPSGEYVYAVNEVGELRGEKSGGVSAYRVDPGTGELTFLNQQLSHGGAPCYIVVDSTGKNVLVANYGGGSVAVLPIRDDGSLGEAASFVQHEGSSVNAERQEGPHAHSINLDVTNRHALAADLGLDKVLVYRFDSETGTLTENDPSHASVKPGAGPRHLSFHPGGRFAYVVNELDMTVTVFAYDADQGTLSQVQSISTLPGETQPEYSTAEIRVHPSGKFLYASNRGHDTIAVFAIDKDSGKLTPVEHEHTGGRTPRNFTIDPTGRFLLAANQNSDNVVVFGIDQETGALTPTGHSASVSTPVCVRIPAADPPFRP